MTGHLDRGDLDLRLGEVPAISLLAMIEPYRYHGEDLFETARRLLMREALQRTGGNQERAAIVLGISPRMICHHLANYGARPIDLRRERGAA